MTANLSVEIRREHEKAVAEAMEKAGSIFTRASHRAQDLDNVVDSKVLFHLRLFDSANIPARETVKMTAEVDDVEKAVKSIESELKGRIVDSRHSRNASGRRESLLTIDVPLREATAIVDRIKSLGTVLDHVTAKNAGVPNNDLALARLEVTITNEVLVAHDSGPWANIKRGLAISLQAASWSLMLIMIGLCFVLPILLIGWGAFRLHRRFRTKPAPAAGSAL